MPPTSVSMIPGAYETNAPLHRASRVTAVAPTLLPTIARADARDAAYVVSASPRPTTWLGQSAVMLGDLAAAIGVVFAVALVPILAARAIIAVWTLLAGR